MQYQTIKIEDTTLSIEELSMEERLLYKIPINTVKNLRELALYQFDDRYVCDQDGVVYLIKKIEHNNYICNMMSSFLTRDGYVEYVLSYPTGVKKHLQAHRIVAGLYLTPINNKPYVNHKDGIRTNNNVNNLEYVTHSENIKHSYDYIRPLRLLNAIKP